MKKQEDLNRMKTGEVANLARKAGVQGVEHMNKQQLIEAMGAAPPKSAMPGQGGGQGDTPPPPGTRPQDWKNIPGNQS